MTTRCVERESGWIVFDAPVPRSATLHRDAWALAVASGRLPGGAKFALCRGAVPLRLRAELPETAASRERLAAVEAGFAAAGCRLRGDELPALDPAPQEHDPALALPDLCRETGWPFDERESGVLSVDLEVPGAYVPACIRPEGLGFAAEAELSRLATADADCRGAVAALLLRVNGAFRLARAALRPGDGAAEATAVLEVQLPGRAGADALREALGALAVAARRCAREARLLGADAEIAREYLAHHGPRRGH